jgi:hypothetical protein
MVCSDQSYVLTANSSNIENETYQWVKDGVDMPGETGSSLNIITSGSYSLKTTNNGICTDESATVDLEIVKVPDGVSIIKEWIEVKLIFLILLIQC